MKNIVSAGFLILAATPLSFLLSPAEGFSQPIFAPPVNLGPKINTALHESDPFLTADGKKLFFVRDGIYCSEWTDTGWTNAVKLGPSINGGLSLKKSPSVSPDGQKLYFVIGAASWDIYVSTWDSSVSDWGVAVRLPYPVNTSGDEFSARIGPDGQHLYFCSSAGPDSLFPSGRCGFYVSEWNGANWSVPVGVYLACNTEEYPSITADGRWLYFDQFVFDGKSSFVSEWTGTSWGPAVDLRPQIGGRSGTPFITASGDSLLIAGAPELGGFGGLDIWLMERVQIAEKVPTLENEVLIILVLVLTLTGIYWMKNRSL